MSDLAKKYIDKHKISQKRFTTKPLEHAKNGGKTELDGMDIADIEKELKNLCEQEKIKPVDNEPHLYDILD